MIAKPKWPEQPYKGLSFYSDKDVLIFAGRDSYVVRCAQLLSRGQTRILVLNGPTGCGKSSFLRAGLIPFLESHGGSFEFLRNGENTMALFIRSTDNPLAKIAEQVFEYASKDIESKTPLGTTHILKLTDILRLSGEKSQLATKTEFLEKVGKDPKRMIETLRKLSRKLSRTIVLIVDQGEEVLTLKPGKDGHDSRDQFFEFMYLFSQTTFDLKLMVALRSEFCPKFYDQFQAEDNMNVSSLYLRDLTEEQLIDAIKRPTLKQDIFNCGMPHDRYRFAFEEGLPEMIAADLMSKNLQGGILPVMQLVCNRLYQKTKDKNQMDIPWMITKKDYATLGSIEEQVEGHLIKMLDDLCDRHRLSLLERERETTGWRDVLSPLARRQADGTVTTDFKTAKDLEASAGKAKCKLDFQETMDYLSSDDTRILRRFEVIIENEPTPCYSLGHDVIGLVLQRWKVTSDAEKTIAKQRMRSLVIGMSFIIFIGIIIRLFTTFKTTGNIIAIYGSGYWVMSILLYLYPNSNSPLLRIWGSILLKRKRSSIKYDGVYR